MRYISNSNILICILLFLSGLTGCSSDSEIELPEHIRDLENLLVYSKDQEPPKDIIITHETDFEPDPDHLIGAVRDGDIDVDDHGRLYVLDYQQYGFHVFQPDGEYFLFVGGEGAGPGEFRSTNFLRVISGDIFVYDYLMSRLMVFDMASLENTETRSVRPIDYLSIEEQFDLSRHSSKIITIKKDGNFIVALYPLLTIAPQRPELHNVGNDRLSHYYLMDPNGRIIGGKLFELKEAQTIPATVGNRVYTSPTELDLVNKPLLEISEEDQMYISWSDEFLIKKYDSNGIYLESIFYPVEKKKLIYSDVLQNVSDHSGNDYTQTWVQNIDELPETWPAIGHMTVDDKDRIWVSTFNEDYSLLDWWVLEDDGRLQSRFTWPRDRIIEKVMNGNIYARVTDNLGGITFVRYGFELN